MRTTFTLAATAFALAVTTVAAEVTTTKERTYVVKYSDQSLERYSVKWTLDVSAKLREEGGSYVPYQGATENRRCTWSVTSGIERTVSLATRQGQTIPLTGMGRALAASAPLTGEHPGACGTAAPQRDALDNAKRSALASFEKITEADLEELRQAARAKADVSAVTAQ